MYKSTQQYPQKNNIYMTMYEVYAQENMKEMNISTNVGLLNIQLASFFFLKEQHSGVTVPAFEMMSNN